MTLWTAAPQGSLSITNFLSLLKLKSIESVMPSNLLILCCPLLRRLQSSPASGSFPISPFTSGGQSMGVPTSASVLPMNTQDWFSFRIFWLNLLAVQGTLKSLFQLHSSKASILQRSAYFTVRLSHPYMSTRKTIAVTRWTFVGKVMSLPFFF